MPHLGDIWKYFGYLGMTAFGGPAAHISIFHALFVDKLHWMDDRMFSEIFAIGQALPGPGSTQMAFIIALHHSGLMGAILAFILWSMPGLVVMIGLAVFAIFVPASLPQWAILLRYGFSAVAVGLVAAAAYRLSSNLLKDNFDRLVCWASACAGILGSRAGWVPPCIIACGGLLKYAECKLQDYHSGRYFTTAATSAAHSSELAPLVEEDETEPATATSSSLLTSITVSVVSLSIFTAGLIASFIILSLTNERQSAVVDALKVVSSFYVTGSIIFGGGPVVIPLLFNYVVQPGWVSSSDFLFGFAIINVMPGPNFNFGAYCAALSFHHLIRPDDRSSTGIMYTIVGGLLGYFGIFFPGLAVKVGIMPLWKYVRTSKRVKDILHGVSATAIGMVFSAIVTLWFDALGAVPVPRAYTFVCIAITSFVGTAFFKIHPLLLILIGGCVSLLYLLE